MTDRSPVWIARVRAGDFDAIPKPFTWEQSCEFAHLINGYELTGGGHEGVAAISRRVFHEIRTKRKPNVTALDLWVTLFWQHRGYRHQGYPPGKDAERELDRLCERLRKSLVEATSLQRCGLLAALCN